MIKSRAVKFALAFSAALPFSFSGSTQAATVTIGDGIVYSAVGDNGGQIDAGRSGNGSVTIDGGDTVTLESGTSSDELTARPKIDVGDGGVGTVTVTGAGTTVNLNGTNSGSKLEVGTFAGNAGTLKVLDGATINMMDDGPLSGDDNENVFLQFGEDEAVGTLIMDNGTINATGYSKVGMLVGIAGNTPIAGNGIIDMIDSTINMTNLGNTELSFIIVGDQSNGVGDVGLVNSEITLNTPNESAFFGLGTDGGSGNVSLAFGSNLAITADSIEAIIAEGGGASGTITVDSGSTTSFNSTGEVNFEVGRSAGSTGSITLLNGSQFEIFGTSGLVQIGSDAPTTTLGSGTVSVVDSTFESSVGIQVGSAFTGQNNQTGEINLNVGVVRAPEIVVANGGKLTGVGTVDAVKTVLSGGIISPGLSPGILEFTGDLELNSGSLFFEIGGTAPSLFDSIIVGGNLFATDTFNLQFNFVNGFLPSETDIFEIFRAGSIDSDLFSFANIVSNALLSFNTSNGAISVSFDPVEPVPLPAALPLLAAGLAAMGFLGWRRRKAAGAG